MNKENLDDTKLSFGKYKGYSPNDIADFDPSYITWMYVNVKPTPCTKELYEDCESVVREGEEENYFGIEYWNE